MGAGDGERLTWMSREQVVRGSRAGPECRGLGMRGMGKGWGLSGEGSLGDGPWIGKQVARASRGLGRKTRSFLMKGVLGRVKGGF